MSEERKYIPVEECKPGHVYRLHSRNLSFGVYAPKGDSDGFIGIRLKFTSRYLFTEYHHDTGGAFGTVLPLEDLGPLKDERILLQEYLPSMCRYCGERAEQFQVENDDGKKVYERRHLGGDRDKCPDPPDLTMPRNRPLYNALERIEREAGEGASTEYVWVLMGGGLDADGDPWKPNTQFSIHGAGGVCAVFETRTALLDYVDENPPAYEDYKADKWTEDRGGHEPSWYTGPLTHGRGYQWLTAIKMRLNMEKGESVW